MGRSIAGAGAIVLLTLMAGCLWVVGYVVAPTLFSVLERARAGEVAGHLFTIVAWIVITATPAVLLLDRAVLHPAQPWVAVCLWLILGLALIGHFGIRPQIAALKAAQTASEIGAEAYRAAFGRWHAISAAVYMVESVLAAAIIVGWRRRGEQ